MPLLSNTNAFRRCVAWISLLALGFCALIPAGYMPDFSGNGHGILPLVICDGMDHSGASADHVHMHHDGTPHSQKGHGICPFCTGAVYALSGITPPALPAAVFITQDPPVLAKAAHYRHAAYSNASPRSPPVFS